MKKAKKVLSIGLCIFLMLSVFAGCADEEKDSRTDKLKVVATIFPLYDYAREIGGDCAQVDMLIPPGAEVHAYEPTPKDIMKIQDCDVFLYIGGESDYWAQEVLKSVDTEKIRVVALIDSVDTLSAHAHHKGETEVDEHIWTSPKNAVLMCETILSAFTEKDGENGEQYRKNAENYISELKSLDAEIEKTVQGAKRHTLVFADRFAMRYFVRDYNLDYISAYPGCAMDAEPSAKVVAEITDRVKEEKIPVILYIEFSNHQIADSIAESTGSETRMFHTCHNVSTGEFEDGVGYIQLMRENLSVLKEALY